MYIVSQENGKQLASWDAFDIMNFLSSQIEIELSDLEVSQWVLHHSSHSEMSELIKNI